jgi:glycosyltransferase involved in cell wall biosynthesis
MALRVAVLTQHGRWSASTRFRAVQHLERLGDRLGNVDLYLADDPPQRRPGRVGQAIYFAGHARRYASRYREVSSIVPGYDALFVQRALYSVGPGAIARAVEHFDGRVVYDLDDDLYSDTPASQGKGAAAHWLYGPQQARRILARADDVVVSTEVLAGRIPSATQSITVLPTVPDVATYERAIDGGTPGLIGWAGTNGGLRYLDPLAPVFRRLADDGVGRLRVVSSVPWSGPSEFSPWRLEDEPRLFAPFAVGIMPLPDTEYAQAKAGFKLLQYMASGLPVVASPVGVNRELVERSGAGLLAATPDEWEDALRTLLADGELRRSMGASGRSFVEGFADLEAQADTLAGLLRGDGAQLRPSGPVSSPALISHQETNPPTQRRSSSAGSTS